MTTNHLLLITGCSRSGTGYISHLMCRAGIDIGHEEYGNDGISSWLLAVDADKMPWGPTRRNVTFQHIFHQVRHPLKTIGSIYTHEPEESFAYSFSHLPEFECYRGSSKLVRSACYWYGWNLLAEAQAEFTYRVENVDQAIPEIARRLGRAVPDDIVKTVPTDVNNKGWSRPLRWKDLERNIPEEVYTKIVEMAKRYGYE